MEVNLDSINQPTLLIDQNICHNNIVNMVNKAKRHAIKLRPHFKSHQSAMVANWFRSYGVASIATSSFEMAEYFALHGWDDITVAFPVNIREIDTINKLAKQIDLGLLVESMDQVNALDAQLKFQVKVYLKIDVGYGRTGLLPKEDQQIDTLIQQFENTSHMEFEGFLAHAGHTYEARNKDQIIAIHEDALAKLNTLKNHYRNQYPKLTVSLGDTPSASVAENFMGIDELRPGNFVFYDLKQYQIGSCSLQDIAVAAVCPIVAIHSDREEIVVYGGAVHLSKDFMIDEELGKHYGLVASLKKQGWGAPLPFCYVKSLSQEHGIIKMDPTYLSQYKVGDLICILPPHSCLVMDIINNVVTLEGRKVPKFGIVTT